MRRPWRWWVLLSLFLGGCAILPKTITPLASPSAGGDQMVGANSKVTTKDGPVGGIAGKIGGDGDSIALWGAIAGLTLISLVAYPAQRGLRLAWNSWRGVNGTSRKGKGKEVCIKFAEWDS